MKARLPQGYGKGSGNLAGMMKQAQKMQEDMTALQAELETTEYEATVGGGAVTAVVTGKKELKSLSIKPEVVDPEDIEMLQDLIVAAVNEAYRLADSESQNAMSKLTGGLGGLGGLGF